MGLDRTSGGGIGGREPAAPDGERSLLRALAEGAPHPKGIRDRRAGRRASIRFARLDERLTFSPNPRAPTASAQGPLIVSPDATYGDPFYPDPDRSTWITAAFWNPALDTARACVARSAPWYRSTT